MKLHFLFVLYPMRHAHEIVFNNLIGQVRCTFICRQDRSFNLHFPLDSVHVSQLFFFRDEI
jgi:hypothetical protein